MTTTPNPKRAAFTGSRRAMQLLRGYRAGDVKAMNAVVAEMSQDNSGSDVLYALLAFTSTTLDRFVSADETETLLSDLLLDYHARERTS